MVVTRAAVLGERAQMNLAWARYPRRMDWITMTASSCVGFSSAGEMGLRTRGAGELWLRGLRRPGRLGDLESGTLLRTSFERARCPLKAAWSTVAAWQERGKDSVSRRWYWVKIKE